MRERFEENYTAVQKPCDSRRKFKIAYQYTGPWYRWNAPARTLRRMKKKVAAAGAAVLFFFSLGSLQFVESNYSVFVAAPSSLSLIALLYECIGIVQFYFAKEQMTTFLYHGINSKLRLAPLIHSVLMGVAVLGCLYQMIWQQPGPDAVSYVVLGAYAICAGLSVWISRMYRTLEFVTEKNAASKQKQNHTQ